MGISQPFQPLSNENLVTAVQLTDDKDACNELYVRVQESLGKRCSAVKRNYSFLPMDEIVAGMDDAFLKAVKTFDASKGVPFVGFLSYVLTNSAISLTSKYTTHKRVVGSDKGDKDIRVRKLRSLISVEKVMGNLDDSEGITGFTNGNDFKDTVDALKQEFELFLEPVKHELFTHINEVNPVYGDVLRLKIDGYTEAEIADIMRSQFTGADPRQQVKRVMKAIRKLADTYMKD